MQVLAVRKSGRFAWVEFTSIQAAHQALTLDGELLGANMLKISQSKTPIHTAGWRAPVRTYLVGSMQLVTHATSFVCSSYVLALVALDYQTACLFQFLRDELCKSATYACALQCRLHALLTILQQLGQERLSNSGSNDLAGFHAHCFTAPCVKLGSPFTLSGYKLRCFAVLSC